MATQLLHIFSIVSSGVGWISSSTFKITQVAYESEMFFQMTHSLR